MLDFCFARRRTKVRRVVKFIYSKNAFFFIFYFLSLFFSFNMLKIFMCSRFCGLHFFYIPYSLTHRNARTIKLVSLRVRRVTGCFFIILYLLFLLFFLLSSLQAFPLQEHLPSLLLFSWQQASFPQPLQQIFLLSYGVPSLQAPFS